MDCITRDAFRDVGRKVRGRGEGSFRFNITLTPLPPSPPPPQVEELVRDDEEVRGMLRDMWGW
jgi:hypothetical protein